MKYKVGDKVRLKNGLINRQKYGSISYYDIYPKADYTVKFCDTKDNTYLCIIPDKCECWFSDEMLEPVYADGDFCAGFKGGKKPEYVLNEKQAKEYADNIMATAESILNITGISYEDSINKLKTWLGAFSNDGISAKNGGKNSMKFTFYVKEGTRIDKSCNKTVPTMTTFITAESYGDSTYHGAATCDKADYNERQGCLEALANAMLGGNFDRDFNRAVKANELADKKKRTCKYCGKVFDTVEEREAEEAWHVERKKARRERYLLRKRAKEIAFEEQAQKMAREMMGEQK